MSSNSKPKSETSLAIRDGRVDLWRDPEWQRLWLALQTRTWTSLAIVPAAEGASRDFTLRIAVILSRIGMVHLSRPVQVADATNVPLSHLTQFMDEIAHCTKDGDPILVALPPVVGSPLTISIAQAVDVALLCVLVDHMSTTQTKRTVTQIGQSRFIGSALFRGDGLIEPSPSSRPPPRPTRSR